MKKYIILSIAALTAMVACSKIETSVDVQREISFEVANGLQTKATGAIYENGAFGTYAWFNNTDNFMVNEQVDKVSSVWKTVNHTFYWPKTGSISFISYSPFVGESNTAGTVPAVIKGSDTDTFTYKIKYENVTVGTTDLMYADRATCSANIDEVTDGDDTADSGFTGVPTVFRHALAKLSFNIKANFIEYTDPTTNTTTSWEVTVKSAKISGFKTKGDCELNLNSDGKSWDKPVTNIGTTEDPINVNVWTNTDGASAEQELVDATTYPNGVVLATTAKDLAAASGYVLPQVLTADTQKLELKVHIKTTLSNGLEINEDFNPTIDIKDISNIKAWQMNQNIVYTINIKPVAYVSDNDTPNDVIITFDPAVASWETISTNATIQL